MEPASGSYSARLYRRNLSTPKLLLVVKSLGFYHHKNRGIVCFWIHVSAVAHIPQQSKPNREIRSALFWCFDDDDADFTSESVELSTEHIQKHSSVFCL